MYIYKIVLAKRKSIENVIKRTIVETTITSILIFMRLLNLSFAKPALLHDHSIYLYSLIEFEENIILNIIDCVQKRNLCS